MSRKPFVHRGESSWWHGTFTTLCGQVFELRESRSPWFLTPKCPACEAIHAAGKR